ncbi:Hpt domain-containing protein [Spirosoma sp. KCTC 42546]|uniref:Hpt domain-containing protein n=1 Tax=Spirosoma sp. KCTC 42546 TaxID=2520506 RepID=UPI00115B1EC7|nr:Hpt domain-containing protein [Spirosoma sp. KCTC 42546]QDK82678.1 Hpt domain-containing protein [Spirosoma sp. KCTC 42546]
MRTDPDLALTQVDQRAGMVQEGNRLANTPSTHLLDTERLRELYGEDTAYAASMFETFLETVWPEFDTFDTLIAEQRWVDIRLLAHKLRPTLGMVGLSDLEILLAQFEELAATTTKSERISRLWNQLHSDLISCKPLVQAEWQRLLTTTIP